MYLTKKQTQQQQQQLQQQQVQQQQSIDRLYNGVAHNREDPMTAPQAPQWIIPNRASQLETLQQQPYIGKE